MHVTTKIVNGTFTEVSVLCSARNPDTGKHESYAVIGRARVGMGETIENATARAMREAADWLEAGAVNLVDTGGRLIARTPTA
jgi:hypothetical protein